MGEVLHDRENSDYEDGLRDGKIDAIGRMVSKHGERLDDHEKRLRYLEKDSIWADWWDRTNSILVLRYRNYLAADSRVYRKVLCQILVHSLKEMNLSVSVATVNSRL